MASTKAKIGFIKGSPIIDVAELPNPVTKSAISPTGTYEMFYFNTSLSFDAVDNILNNLDYGDIEQYYIYLGIDSSNMPIRYIVISRIEDYVNESGYAYSIRVANQSDNILIYNSQNYQGNVKGFRNFDNPLGITFSGGIEQLVIEGMTIIAGQQNELLKDLVYVEEVNENAINTKALYRLPDGTLWHYYNGQWNAVGSGGGSGNIIIPLTEDMMLEDGSFQLNEEQHEKIIDSSNTIISFVNEEYGMAMNFYKVMSNDTDVLFITNSGTQWSEFMYDKENKLLSEFRSIPSTSKDILMDVDLSSTYTLTYQKLEIDSSTGVANLSTGSQSLTYTSHAYSKINQSYNYGEKASFEIPALITAIQNLCTYIATLEARIKALEEA